MLSNPELTAFDAMLTEVMKAAKVMLNVMTKFVRIFSYRAKKSGISRAFTKRTLQEKSVIVNQTHARSLLRCRIDRIPGSSD